MRGGWQIEAMPHAVLLDETQFSRLSEQERVHLEAYVELLEQHMMAAGLAHFPAVFRNQRDIRTSTGRGLRTRGVGTGIGTGGYG